MADSANGPVIGIFGHYGNQNLGDEAIIQAILQNLRARHPNAIFYGFSACPEDTAERYQISAFPIRANLAGRGTRANRAVVGSATSSDTIGNDGQKANQVGLDSRNPTSGVKKLAKELPGVRLLYRVSLGTCRSLITSLREIRFCLQSARVLTDVDVLIITGSNQFLDNFGGPWGFPFTLLKWAVLAKLTGTSLLYVSVGAGPLEAKLSKFLIRLALLFSDFTSFRDTNSMRLIEATGYSGSRFVFPDLAHSLKYEALSDRVRVNGQKPTIGINPMPLYDSRYWCETDDSRYRGYVRKLAQATSELMREGYSIFFFATQQKDENVIADVVEMLDSDAKAQLDEALQIKHSRTVDDLMANILSADLVIATRFHGTVLSLHAARAVVAICYYRKTNDIMREMGQIDYALDFDTLDVSELVDRVRTLASEIDRTTAEIRRKNAEYERALDDQYKLIEEFIVAGRRRCKPLAFHRSARRDIS
jgi:polysaccharide pyruvyl transferase WcaK-like protein